MGMVTGMVVGAAIASSAASTGSVPGNAVMSPNGHDIIVCKAGFGDNEQKCSTRADYISPDQYAGNAGYKTLYRRGVMFVDHDRYIVMEVGR